MVLRALNSENAVLRALFWVLAASALFFLVKTAWPRPPHYPLDFKFFWLAGEFWLRGESPYGAPYLEAGAAIFPDYQINPFFYPPNWRLLASFFALSPPWAAASLWAFASVGAIVGAAMQSARTAQLLYPHTPFWSTFAVVLFACANLIHAAEYAVLVGQASPILCLAVAGLLLNAFKPNVLLSTLWLTILFLKPQLTASIAVAALFIPSLHKPLLIAIAATVILTAFGLGVDEPMAAARSFAANLSAYQGDPANNPMFASGLNLFVYSSFDAALHPLALLGFTCASTAAAGAVIYRNGQHTPLTAASLIAFALAFSLFVMSGHTYDFLMLAPILILIGKMNLGLRLVAILGAFLFMRASTLGIGFREIMLVEPWTNIAILDTVSAGVLAIAFAILLTGICRNSLRTAQS